jgi:hypothetical protein
MPRPLKFPVQGREFCPNGYYGKAPAHTNSMRTSILRFGLALILSSATPIFAQTAKDDIKRAGQDVKEAGKDTKNAAKNTGKATAKTARTAGRKVKHGTNKTASKVEEKTRDKQ